MSTYHWKLVFAVMFYMAALLFAPLAQAAQCGPRATLTDQLLNKYKETPVAMGLVNETTMVEVFASDDGETFTIVTSNARGLTCILGAGNGWEVLRRIQAKGEQGS